MKSLPFIIAIIGLVSQWGKSQVTCPGANFTTQTEVNQYVSNYPGCEEVTGSLDFYNDGSDPINDVSGLSSVIKINGGLRFYGTDLLDISLNALDSVMGTFDISNNANLSNFSMNNLKYVQNGITIDNFSNNSINVELPNLSHASHFYLSGINNLYIPLLEATNFMDIDNVANVTGFNNVVVMDHLSIYAGNVSGFNSLQSLNSFNFNIDYSINGFNSLTSFPSNNSLSNLESFIGFNAVTLINGSLKIQSNIIDAFNGLTQVNGNIELTGSNISGFGVLQSTQNLTISASGNIPQFNSLTSVNNISIGSPQAVIGFNILQTAENISITSVGNISGFSALENINGNLIVNGQNISGFDAVENFNVISIQAQSLSGFNNLKSGNQLNITIPTVSGLESLTDLSDGLTLNSQNINGFNFLTSCPAIIFQNANNIIGFNGLTSTSNLNMNAPYISGFNALQSGQLQFQNNQIIEGFNSYNQPLNLNFNGQKINGFNAVTSGLYNIAADTIIGFNGLTSSSNLNLNAPYISGFNAIVSADQLNITTQNLSGFNTLTQANNINITADAISGFGSLSQVAILNLIGDLNTFDAFAQLDTISLSLSLQTQRSDYNIFPTLQNVEEVSISNSPNFTGSAFFPLAKIKNLFISNCGSLTNLSGLLPRSKYGTLILNNNPSLADLTGLETVKNVVNLTINGNTSLTNIEALDSLRIIQGNLSLVNNTSLNECCVLAFIINRNKVFGFIEISGNAHDCEDIVMVLEETCLDSDGDGLADPQDNCPTAHNTDQSDIDGDGVGDMCDNCIDIANSGQEDDNGDGIGNVCQPTAGTGYMDLNNSDLYITNNQRGVILKTRSGNCYRIRIDESGKVLSIPLLQCP